MAASATAKQLEALLGSGLVISAAERLEPFRLDGLSPAAAVLPETPEQVAQILALAVAEGWAVVPWGGGHGISSGAPPAAYDVALSLSRLEAVLDHDVENLTLTAEGGLTLNEANRRIHPAHQFLPLGFPGERNTLGGLVAAARPVPKRLLYGDVRDMLIGVRVALADGSLVRYGRKVIKNVAGYDMNKLFLGSQGMLGVIVEATFKLFALPDEERYVPGVFSDPAQAARTATALLASPLLPACLFLLEPGAAAGFAAREHGPLPGKHGPPPGKHGPPPGESFLLLIGFEGRGVALRRQVREAREMIAAQDGEPGEPLPALAEGSGPFLRGVEPPADGAVPPVDGAVPPVDGAAPPVRLRIGTTPRELTGLLAGLSASLAAAGLAGRAVADFGGASVWLTVPWRGEDTAEPLARWIAARREELAPLRGSVVLEAAPPALKARCHVWGELEGEMEIMRLLKARLDPHGIMVPGRYLEHGAAPGGA